jgi:hypothetical protein
MAGRWELTVEQWELVGPITRCEDKHGRPWHDTRAVLNGALWIFGSGAQRAQIAGNILRARRADLPRFFHSA